MNNSEQQPKKPSQKILDTLKQMAAERDVSFTFPSTMAQAREQYRELKKIPRKNRRDQHREDRAVRAAVAAGGDGARFREEELGGHGSTAHFR